MPYSDAGLVRTPDGREFDCYFYDDVERLRAAMGALPANPASLGQLLIGFFRRYAREFDFVKSVTSIRTGAFLTKHAKNWDKKEAGFRGDRHLFCMEDPFELTHDLGRVMDRDTLRDVRSEIDRADSMLSERSNSCSFNLLVQPYQAKGGREGDGGGAGGAGSAAPPPPPPPPPLPTPGGAQFPPLPGFAPR